MEDTKIELEAAQYKKTEAVMFRSKAKWDMEGERPTKYFLNMEKARYNAKTCNVLIDEATGETIKEPYQVLEHQRLFYQELYSSDVDVDFSLPELVTDKVPEGSPGSCEDPFKEGEYCEAIKSLRNGSCPGPDGLPIEFYKVFWRKIGPIFSAMVQEAYENQLFCESSRRGVINVIPKGNKDTRFLKNLRPITLLNSDYKIVEKVIANRMIPALDCVISPDQTGFIPGRRISSNIRKILDAVHNTKEDGEQGIIISCDYLKCFDRIETNAVLKSMEQFGFAEILINWVRILYSEFKVKVQNNGNFSGEVHVTRSVHHGEPASNALFFCVAELIAIMLRNDEDISQLVVKSVVQFLNQFADDMDVMMEFNQKSFDRFLAHIEKFHYSTGFMLSYDKTTVYRIGSLADSNAKLYSARAMNWSSDTINVLGIHVYQTEIELQANYVEVISKMRDTVQAWDKRNLSLYGKVCIINSLVASLFVYKMSVLPTMSENLFKEIRTLCEKYLWNGNKPKIKLSTLCRSRGQGGLKLTDFKLKDGSLKASWVKLVMQGSYSAEYVYKMFKSQE